MTFLPFFSLSMQDGGGGRYFVPRGAVTGHREGELSAGQGLHQQHGPFL